MHIFARQYGVRDFEFLDDNFNFKEERVIQFCELFLKGLEATSARRVYLPGSS
jgi:hypothetical protein